MAKTPKNNATSPAPSGKTPQFTSENTPRHKLLAMGQHPKVSSGGAKTRP